MIPTLEQFFQSVMEIKNHLLTSGLSKMSTDNLEKLFHYFQIEYPKICQRKSLCRTNERVRCFFLLWRFSFELFLLLFLRRNEHDVIENTSMYICKYRWWWTACPCKLCILVHNLVKSQRLPWLSHRFYSVLFIFFCFFHGKRDDDLFIIFISFSFLFSFVFFLFFSFPQFLFSFRWNFFIMPKNLDQTTVKECHDCGQTGKNDEKKKKRMKKIVQVPSGAQLITAFSCAMNVQVFIWVSDDTFHR